MRLSVFRELLSLRCINLKNLCAHHQEKVLRIPKHLLSIFLMNLSQVLAKSKKNLIVLYCSLFSGDREQFIKISHEISHAWFGIIIGSLDWTEAWISEGFATFLEGFIHDEALKFIETRHSNQVYIRTPTFLPMFTNKWLIVVFRVLYYLFWTFLAAGL